VIDLSFSSIAHCSFCADNLPRTWD